MLQQPVALEIANGRTGNFIRLGQVEAKAWQENNVPSLPGGSNIALQRVCVGFPQDDMCAMRNPYSRIDIWQAHQRADIRKTSSPS